MVSLTAPRRVGQSAIIVELIPGGLAADESDRVASFLELCEPLILSPGYSGDGFLEEGGGYVRLGEMTDGQWVWPLAWSDYVKVHRVEPPLEFLEHIRNLNYRPIRLDPTDVDLLIDRLFPPGDDGEPFSE